MNKKILAVALAILFIATAFTACKTKLDMTEINGTEYPLLTDENGETIINEDNQVAVIVTDRDGEVVTYENGEEQTHWLQINGPIIVENQVRTKESTLDIPKGWEASEISGKVVKKHTDNKCYISFGKVTDLKKGETIDTYLDVIDAQNETIAEAFADEEKMKELAEKDPRIQEMIGGKYTMEDKGVVTIAGLYNGQHRVHKIVNKDGDVIHYAENYYFVAGNTLYSISYACEEGKGYDPDFSFASYVSNNFKFKEPKK